MVQLQALFKNSAHYLLTVAGKNGQTQRMAYTDAMTELMTVDWSK